MQKAELLVAVECICGSHKLVVTHRGTENHVAGYCLACKNPFSGSLLILSSSPVIKSAHT